MDVGELKAFLRDIPDDKEIFVDFPDDDGDIPALSSAEVDEDGDVILIPDGE